MNDTIIGQNKLKSIINDFTLDNFPRTLLLIGEQGCGKSLFSEIIAKKLGLPLTKIMSDVTNRQLLDYAQRAVPTFYSINLADFAEKQQNQILKFIEEPSSTTYIVLMAASEVGILPTILNRCQKIYFEPYTLNELSYFKNTILNENDFIYEICTTPGQIIGIDGNNLLELKNICDLLLQKIKKASYANVISLVNKINVKADSAKDEKDQKNKLEQYDLNIFIKVLEHEAYNYYLSEGTNFSFNSYLLINKTKQYLINKKLSKEAFLINFLTNYWKEAALWN